MERDALQSSGLSPIPLDLPERPWLPRLVVAIAVLGLGFLAPYYSQHLVVLSGSLTKRHIDDTVTAPYVRNAERVAFSDALRLTHPLSALESETREMLFTSPEESPSSHWASMKHGPNADIFAMAMFSSLNANEFSQPISALKFFGYGDEEFRVLQLAMNEKSSPLPERYAANWLDRAYIGAAHFHFERKEYFLAMAAVQDAIKRARIHRVDNLRGSDGFTKTLTPLVIIDAFFPLSPENVVDPAADNNKDAIAVLDDDFDQLAIGGSEKSGLRTYAAGVLAFRKGDFDEAVKRFSSLRNNQYPERVQGLSGFMVTRSLFWMHHKRISAIKATDENASNQVDVNDQAEPTENDDSSLSNNDSAALVRLFARALAEELAKALGKYHPQRSSKAPVMNSNKQVSVSAKPKGLTHAQLLSLRRMCRTANDDIGTAYQIIRESHWKAQAAVYWEATAKDCNAAL